MFPAKGDCEAFLIKLFLKAFEEPEAVFSPKQTILWKRMRYQKETIIF